MDVAQRSARSSKGWLTRAVNEIEKLAQDITSVSGVRYDSSLKTFHERLSKWDEAQTDLELLVEENKLDDMINEAADYREKAIQARDNLVDVWIEAHPQDVAEEERSSAASQSGTTSSKPTVNLPRIDLPKFSGDVLKFTSFWQQFTACVDDCDYPTIAKFNYLMSCLKGEASTVIEGLPITAENYDAAKQMLKKRFGRKELIVFAHVQELLALSVPEQLSRIRDTLNVHVRSLSTQGITADNFGVDLF